MTQEKIAFHVSTFSPTCHTTPFLIYNLIHFLFSENEIAFWAKLGSVLSSCIVACPKNGDVGRLHVEISMVYLVYSTLSRLANQNIGLSAEVSLIYSEYNDGLQNYSFKFHSFCFDF